MVENGLKFFLLCVGIISFSGCAVNLPFNHRLAYSQVSEAKRLNNKDIRPVSIEWSPKEFPNRIDVQGASGFVGGGSQTRIPTGVGLSNRIIEALDTAIGIDNNSKSVLEIEVLKAESKFQYSAGFFNVTPAIDYGFCEFEAQFNYNGTKWSDHFISEVKDSTIGGTSATGPLESAWDNIALQVVKNVVLHLEKIPSNENYKNTEAYQLRQIEKVKEEKERIEAKQREAKDEWERTHPGGLH